MFKRIVLISLALTFALGILGTSVYRASVQVVAESLENGSEDQENGEMLEVEEVDLETKESVDYALTWPGILPDHFLYPVKMFRDRVWLFFTSDDLKKATLLLKLADKRIWSAQMLADKGKEDLAVTTATKAGKYLERAVSQVKSAKDNEKDVGPFLEKLSLACQKHEEVILKMKDQVNDSNKEAIEAVLDYPRNAFEEAGKMMSE